MTKDGFCRKKKKKLKCLKEGQFVRDLRKRETKAKERQKKKKKDRPNVEKGKNRERGRRTVLQDAY